MCEGDVLPSTLIIIDAGDSPDPLVVHLAGQLPWSRLVEALQPRQFNNIEFIVKKTPIIMTFKAVLRSRWSRNTFFYIRYFSHSSLCQLLYIYCQCCGAEII